MKVFQSFNWPTDEVLACDFDRQGRSTCLVRTSDNALRAEIAGVPHDLPLEWVGQASRIRWISQSDALVWPINAPIGKMPNVGRIGSSGTHVLNVDFPLDVLSDLNCVAFIHSEEMVGGDIISIFLAPELKKEARFFDKFMACFDEPRPGLLEVEHGVLDGQAKCFWFSAYLTEYLWCWRFTSQARQILVCELGCPRQEIVAITCRDDEASVILKRERAFIIRKYRQSDDRLHFESEAAASSQEMLWRDIAEKLDRPPATLRGLSENRMALTTETSAQLIQL